MIFNQMFIPLTFYGKVVLMDFVLTILVAFNSFTIIYMYLSLKDLMK